MESKDILEGYIAIKTTKANHNKTERHNDEIKLNFRKSEQLFEKFKWQH